MNADFMQKFIDVEECGGCARPKLCKKSIVEIPSSQVLMSGVKKYLPVLLNQEAAMETKFTYIL